MQCKFCGAELENGNPVCTECGKDNGSADLGNMEKKIKNMRMALIVAVSVLVLALLAAVLFFVVGDGLQGSGDPSTEGTQQTTEGTIPTDGNPDDETCKGTYTATDADVAAGRETVVATLDGVGLTSGVLQIHYWSTVMDFLNNYSYYLSYWGLDYTKPLDTQTCTVVEGKTTTWQQYFLSNAINEWHGHQALAQAAKKAGFQMPEDFQKDLEGLPERLEEVRKKNNIESVEAMIQGDFGPGCTYEDYYSYMETYYLGYGYYLHLCDSIEVTDAEIEAYFTKNADALKTQYKVTKDSGNVVDVRHILIMPEGGTKDSTTGKTTYSDDEWEACRKKAQEIYDTWMAGEKTEDSFAELAKKHSQDGNAAQGGIYTEVYKGQMVQTFNDWCFDESRKPGDHGLVKTDFGYHIMYFVGAEAGWIRYSRSGAAEEKASELLDQTVESYPVEVTYEKISLGYVNLAG